MTDREKPPVHVAGLMLAAGRSRRFGADKRQALLGDGQGLLAASLRGASEAFSPLWLVLREGDQPQALGVPAGVDVVISAASALGMGHSLADGMAVIALQSSADAAAILLGDMPWIRRESLQQVIAQASATRIVQPTYNGTPGHPVIFGRRFWPELLQLKGDAGARSVLQANPEAVLKVELDDPGILRDVDTPDALAHRGGAATVPTSRVTPLQHPIPISPLCPLAGEG